MWVIPWGVVLRMLADLPYHVSIDSEVEKGSEKEPKIKRKLTPQTSKDFKSFIDNLNDKNKN